MSDTNRVRPAPAAGPIQPQQTLPLANPMAGITSEPSPFGRNVTPDEAKRYAEDTQRRGSRAKPSPTIIKHRDTIKAVLEHGPNKKVMFADLINADPDARAEFGDDGYKAFNARLSREL